MSFEKKITANTTSFLKNQGKKEEKIWLPKQVPYLMTIRSDPIIVVNTRTENGQQLIDDCNHRELLYIRTLDSSESRQSREQFAGRTFYRVLIHQV